jgi:hypothetical protein
MLSICKWWWLTIFRPGMRVVISRYIRAKEMIMDVRG